MANADVFDAYFRRADLDHDGRISGQEAVGFFQGAGLPQVTLAKIWQFSDQSRSGFLSRQEFYNALKLVTVAQTGRELTPELVKAALTGPAAAQIPPPRINTPAPPPSNLGQTPAAQPPRPISSQGNYGQQFPAQGANAQQFSAQGGNGQQPSAQGGFGGPTMQQFSSQGGNIPHTQPQGRFSSVGSRPQGPITMQQPPPRPGLPAAGPGGPQARPSLGGLFGANSSWQPSQTSSQLASSTSLSTGSSFQSNPGSAFQSTPGSAFQSNPGSAYQSTPGSAFQSNPGSAYQSTPGSAFQSTPGSAFQSTPGSAFQSTPGSAFQSTPGSAFQSTPGSGLPTPTAPGNVLSTATSLPNSMGGPGLQTVAGNGSMKTAVSFSSGDLYAAAPPARPAGAGPPSKSKSTPELQAFGDSFRTGPVDPLALAPTTIPSSSSFSKPSGVSQTSSLMPQDSVSRFGPRPLSGPGLTPQWPRMTPQDVQRYTRVFSRVDTDHDGKITGEQARELFLSWQLPKEVLREVWNLSDQDGDSMLSVREFCTALYLMERFREGRPMPPILPPGIHLDDPRGPDGQMPGSQRPGYGGSMQQMPQMQGNMQQMGPGSAPGPGPVRPTLLTTPAGQMQLQNLTSAGGGAPEGSGQPKDAFEQFNFMNRRKQPEKETPKASPRELGGFVNQVTELDKNLMDHKQKSEYYRTKLQEIVLYKSRCDNKLAEITERAAADKREMESLAKKFEEKYKAAAEVNGQLAVVDATHRDVQEKKRELYDALVKMEQGGNPNALLQNRADRIATDLDKLRKALRDRAEILGVEVKQDIPKEMPFGWQSNIQEKATAWNEDWSKFDEEGFVPIEEFMDETSEGPASTSSAKPSPAANWATQGGSALDDTFSSPTTVGKSAEVDEELSVPEPPPADAAHHANGEGPIRNGVDIPVDEVSTAKSDGDGKSGRTTSASKASERYANVAESQEFGSDLFNGATAASSPTTSSDLGRGSITSDAFGVNGSSWGFGLNEDDADSGPRASWGLQSNPPSTQTSLDVTNSRLATRFSKSTGSFGRGDSFDLGSPRTSSIDGTSSPTKAFERNGSSRSHDFDSYGSLGSLTTSKDSNKMSSFFGGNSSPKAAPASLLFGGSPVAAKRDDGFNGSFLRFDSFGPGSPVAPPRASAATEDRPNSFFSRFDSFNSVQTDGPARSGGFHSDDESDIFAGSGPFSAKTPHGSDAWKAF